MPLKLPKTEILNFAPCTPLVLCPASINCQRDRKAIGHSSARPHALGCGERGHVEQHVQPGHLAGGPTGRHPGIEGSGVQKGCDLDLWFFVRGLLIRQGMLDWNMCLLCIYFGICFRCCLSSVFFRRVRGLSIHHSSIFDLNFHL